MSPDRHDTDGLDGGLGDLGDGFGLGDGLGDGFGDGQVPGRPGPFGTGSRRAPYATTNGAIFVGSFPMPHNLAFPTHWHSEHQLAASTKGLIRIGIEHGSWLLPPTRALWIPAGTPHTTAAAGDAAMHSAFIGPRHGPGWRDPTVVAITPLLRALIDHLTRTDLAADARARSEAVLLDELHPVPVTSINVPELRDPRAREVARRLTAAPADNRPLAAWGAEVGASARTLARLFAVEAGLGFGQWRERLRMRAALPHLAEGLPTASVAHRVGYATASSFTAAFRRVVGVTPREYFPVRR